MSVLRTTRPRSFTDDMPRIVAERARAFGVPLERAEADVRAQFGLEAPTTAGAQLPKVRRGGLSAAEFRLDLAAERLPAVTLGASEDVYRNPPNGYAAGVERMRREGRR